MLRSGQGRLGAVFLMWPAAMLGPRDPVLTAATLTILLLLLFGQVVSVTHRSNNKPFHFKEVQVSPCYCIYYRPSTGKHCMVSPVLEWTY